VVLIVSDGERKYLSCWCRWNLLPSLPHRNLLALWQRFVIDSDRMSALPSVDCICPCHCRYHCLCCS